MYETVEDTFKYEIPYGQLIEFGVFSGKTMNKLANAKNFSGVWGFDSFEGIPEESPHVPHNPDWPTGAFNVQKDFDLNSVDEAMSFVRSRVDREDIVLVPGFFEKILTEELGNTLHNSASYIHIDVDIYRSTVEVLDWVIRHRIAKLGCLFRYDDWFPTGWNIAEWEAGNSLAHREAMIKYPTVTFDRKSSNVFILERY